MQDQRNAPLDWSRAHLMTLGARFDHHLAQLGETRQILADAEHRAEQLAYVVEQSRDVLNRDGVLCDGLLDSPYATDPRSTLPTITYATVGELTELLGALDSRLHNMQTAADRIRDVLPHLAEASRTADMEADLLEIVADINADRERRTRERVERWIVEHPLSPHPWERPKEEDAE